VKRRNGFAAVALASAVACSAPPHDVTKAAPPAADRTLLAVRYDQHVAAGGIAPAADTTLHNPFAGKPQLAEEGRKLFSSMNCDGCHSAGGEGWVAPSLNDDRWRYGGSDGALFHSIYFGRPRGMPAFGGILAPDVVWRLVTYIRSMPLAKAVPTQSW